MPNTTTDLFAHKSKSWDMNSKRVKNAKSIAELIVKNINLSKEMEIMDLGAGTGLLSFFIAPFVKKIVAVDNSPSMLIEFENKCDEFVCETEAILKNIATDDLDGRLFNGIISSMTIHHVEDIAALFHKLHGLLRKGGFIAIADLDAEDGSFHSDNTGVFHHGFKREELQKFAEASGFTDVRFDVASTIAKPHRDFTVFLMTARRQ
jgi:cyclopropane fatty-acyl-phospholipid synthase-like methyltransferase